MSKLEEKAKMTVSVDDLKKAKIKLESDIKELLYLFEKTTSFVVTEIKVDRHFVENNNLRRNILYNVKTNITL